MSEDRKPEPKPDEKPAKAPTYRMVAEGLRLGMKVIGDRK